MTTDTAGAGELLTILRDGRSRTRADLVKLTGLARSTVGMRLDALLKQGWVVPEAEAVSSGGRPAVSYAFNPEARVVLAADLGALHARAAVTNLAAGILAERRTELAITEGPETVLGWLADAFTELLEETGHTREEVSGVGVGIPGPVSHETGRPINPPIMPGWDDFDVAGWLGSRLGAPVLVDNDVNIMALGEHWSTIRDVEHMIFVKIGTGIGSGLITEHRLHRGAQGAAGDIGHVRVADADPDVMCPCGNTGCLEAIAGGNALAARLRAPGIEARNAWDVIAQVRAAEPAAISLVREAGRNVGDVLASLVSFFNPSVIVIGGELAEAGEHLLAGVRERVYSRSLPLATANLQIRVSRLGEQVGVIGAAVMVIDEALAPDAIDRTLA
ncbi:ROK family protein [Streptomyces sp. NPDC059010]|uniref:ROK family transcriptional regulator n=1 Tax=Streptomyces sp. NPDC059010 TaxID=3346695 RepID=UPI00367A7D7E